jgi:predicted enzyme related to lactoylglutathione lyase
MSHVNHGRFVWLDLMSKDVDKDRAFLEQLLGLTVDERPMGPDYSYAMLMADGEGMGGINPLEATDPLPSHWIGYVVVSDIAAALAAAEEAGGQVVVPPMDIPDTGRFAVVKDPQGAYFSPLQPASAETMLPKELGKPGQACWWELHTSDPQGAKDFYGKVVGWGSHDVDMGGQPYGLWLMGDDPMNPGGFMKAQAGQPSSWLYYLLVPDVDASTARVGELGGQVIESPRDVPGQGRMSVITMPGGAAMALFTGLPRETAETATAEATAD